jgi:hypothetical protein
MRELSMIRTAILAAALAFGAVSPVLAQSGHLAPGGIRVHGFTNEFEQFYLDVTVVQGGEDLFQIQAVKVYSEPSHTLLYAQVDDGTPVSIFTSVQEEKPLAMTTSTIGEGMARVKIAPPPSGDSRIRVDYVSLANANGKPLTVGESSVSSMMNFDFSAEPAKGKFKLCGFCSGAFCGCVSGATPTFTTCCPSCSITSGLTACP